MRSLYHLCLWHCEIKLCHCSFWKHFNIGFKLFESCCDVYTVVFFPLEAALNLFMLLMWICCLPFHIMDMFLSFPLILASVLLSKPVLTLSFSLFTVSDIYKYAVQSPVKHLGTPVIWHSVACRYSRWMWVVICVWFLRWLYKGFGRLWTYSFIYKLCSHVSFSFLKLMRFVLSYLDFWSYWCNSWALFKSNSFTF